MESAPSAKSVASERLYVAIAAAICVASLVVGLVVAQQRQVGNFGVETDFYGQHLEEAENLRLGRTYSSRLHPPGYAAILAITGMAGVGYFAGAKTITAVSTALLCWLVFLLIRGLFDARVAAGATLLLALLLIPFSVLASTDVLATMLAFAAIWVLFRSEEVTPRACFVAGALAGGAYLVRYTNLYVVIGAVPALFLFEWPALRQAIVKSAWFAAAFLLITSPWLVTNWQLNGSPFSNSAHEHIAAEYFHPDGVALGTAMDEVREEFSSLTDVVLHDPPRFAKEYVARILVRRPEKLASQVVRFPGYLLAAWGLVLLLADLNRRRVALLVLFGLGYLQMGLGIFQTRFYLFLCPILFLFVAIVPFRSSLIGSIRWAFVRHGVAWSMLLLAALSLAHTSRWAIDHTLKIEPRHLLGMATELRSLVEPGQILIGRKPHLARLAGLRPGFVLATDAADFRARSLSIGARYIEYSDAGAKLWPAMATLRDPEALPAGYRLIYTHQGTNTRVYELE